MIGFGVEHGLGFGFMVEHGNLEFGWTVWLLLGIWFSGVEHGLGFGFMVGHESLEYWIMYKLWGSGVEQRRMCTS